MLGKLMKHEFKTTSKVILPLYLILVVLTIFARIFAQSLFTAENSNIDSIGFGLFGGLSVILYILGLFAVSIAPLSICWYVFIRTCLVMKAI